MNDILILDTETAGLPSDFKAAPSHNNNWPHLVQLAWQCYSPSGDLLEEYCQIIKPDGWAISAEAEKTHGISVEVAMEKGITIEAVIKSIMLRLNTCKVVVCHNTGFDKPVVLSEFLRIKNKYPSMQDTAYWIEQVPFYCTMLSTTSLLRIPHPHEYFRKQGQFKWPSLDELHAFLFGCAIEGREDFHDALVDVKGTARCYFELVRRSTTTKSRVTPEMIESLYANQVFVFGSNTEGRHGGGAAHYAHKRFGAELGVSEGMTGKTYAIPTCTSFIEKIGLDTISESVKRFAEHARRTPEAEYLVTPIGCGIAGFTVEEIAPLFSECVNIENVCLPQSFWTILK